MNTMFQLCLQGFIVTEREHGQKSLEWTRENSLSAI